MHLLSRFSFLITKQSLILLCLFLVAVGIKFYKAPYFATYNAEVGQHYLEIIKLLQGQLLLQGPLTSHDWLRLSATPYYIFFPIFVLTRFHPLTLPLLWTVVSTLTLFLNYSVVKTVFSRSTALLSSLFYVLSPNILLLDRNSGFFPFIIPLMYLLILVSYRLFTKQSMRVWLLFLLVSLMFTLHASAIMLLPFFIGLIIFLHLVTRRTILTSALAFLIPQLPFLLNDITQGFTATTHLALWIPYKILNFLSGKTYGVEKTIVQDNSLMHVVDFFKLSLLPPSFPWFTGFFIIIPLLGYLLFLLKKRTVSFETFLLLLLFYGTTALFIHKNPPHHYFVPLVVLPILLLSHVIIRFVLRKSSIILTSFLVGMMLLPTLLSTFSSSYLFRSDIHLPFPTQKKVSQTIITDVGDRSYALARIGPFDYYDDEFKENYVFLLWWLGNRPIDHSLLLYTIEERSAEARKAPGTIIEKIEEVTIYKYIRE